MEQGEPAQPELSTKVGLNSSLNVLPYTFWFLWVHHKEQICVFDDFNSSTNYYRANSPVWTWHMTFPLPPVNQGFLSTLANPSPLWQEQRWGESVEAPFHQLGGMSGAAAPQLPIPSRTGLQQEPLVTTGMMLGCSPAASSVSCSSEFLWQLVCCDISSPQVKSGMSLSFSLPPEITNSSNKQTKGKKTKPS